MFSLKKYFNRVAKKVLAFMIKYRLTAVGNKVALTFDDGPNSEYTIKVLDVLDKYQAKATFFVVSEQADKYPEIINEILVRGHTVANHSVSHAEFADISIKEMKNEISHARDNLIRMGGSSILFRPPKGVVNLKLIILIMLFRLKIILWTKDPKDYAAKNKDVILKYFSKNKIQEGDIILLHDKSQYTVEALDDLLCDLAKNNYQFCSLNESIL